MGSSDQGGKGGAPSRDDKLADALRANLRRRKAAVRKPPAREPHQKPTPSGD
jgi:hypothetical protein